MRSDNRASVTPMQAKVKKLGKTTRVMDLVLTVVWVVCALRSDTTFWQVTFWLFAAFCLLTALTSPMEKLFDLISGRMFSGKKA